MIPATWWAGLALAALMAAGAAVALVRARRRERALRTVLGERDAALETATAALRADRDRLAAALEISRLALWEFNVETGEVVLSEEWSRMLGLPEGPTRTTFQALRELVPAEEHDEIYKAIIAVLKGETDHYDVDHRVRRADGTHLWIRSCCKVTERDARGRAVRILGTNADISRQKSAEAAARETEKRMRLVVDNLPVMINLLDRNFRFLFANRASHEFFTKVLDNPGVEKLEGRTLGELAGADAQQSAASFLPRLQAGEIVTHLRERTDARGRLIRMEVRRVPHFSESGEFVGYFSLTDDITERVAAARALAASEAQLRLVTDGVASLIARIDSEGKVLYANRRYHEFFGLEPGSATGKRVGEIEGPEAQAAYFRHFAVVRKGEPVAYERSANASTGPRDIEMQLVPHRDASGEITSAYVLAHDITERKQVQRLLEEQAMRDPLTNLPNKRQFGDRLAQALAQARRQDSGLALLFVDLDGFKAVNDGLGHAAGDALLREVAVRLKDCVRAADTVARLGGDEFAVILESTRSAAHAMLVAKKLVDSIGRPFRLPAGDAQISSSVGVAIYPQDGDGADALLQHADRAMYRAKKEGKGRAAR